MLRTVADGQDDLSSARSPAALRYRREFASDSGILTNSRILFLERGKIGAQREVK